MNLQELRKLAGINSSENQPASLDQLQHSMQILLSTAYAFSIKAQGYHWNVIGPHFSQVHDFLGNIYEEVWKSCDDIAERIRTMDTYAVGCMYSMQQLNNLNGVPDILEYSDIIGIMEDLNSDNQIVLGCYANALHYARELDETGITNFLEDRMEVHEKHGWMLRSYIS